MSCTCHGSCSAPAVSSVVGVLDLSLVPQNLTTEERNAVTANSPPPIPPGLFRGGPRGRAPGGGRGEPAGLRPCIMCQNKCRGCTFRSISCQKGKGKICDQIAQLLKVWRTWYECRNIKWLDLVPVPVPRNGGWGLDTPPNPTFDMAVSC